MKSRHYTFSRWRRSDGHQRFPNFSVFNSCVAGSLDHFLLLPGQRGRTASYVGLDNVASSAEAGLAFTPGTLAAPSVVAGGGDWTGPGRGVAVEHGAIRQRPGRQPVTGHIPGQPTVCLKCLFHFILKSLHFIYDFYCTLFLKLFTLAYGQ